MLSKIRGLRVASHTSTFSFKGSKIDIPTLAQKLNVATVLEGSVRKAGKRVRITVQLVQVATDSHLWSDTYDRELHDIFAVQDDIAQSVVKELRSALLGDKRGFVGERRSESGSAGRGEGTRDECGGVSAVPAGSIACSPPDTGRRNDRNRASPASGEPRPGVCIGVGRAGVCPDDRRGIRRLDAVRRGVSTRAGGGRTCACVGAESRRGARSARARSLGVRLGLAGCECIVAACAGVGAGKR